MKRAAALLLSGLLLAAGPVVAACGPGQVDLRSPEGKQSRFNIEVADTDAKRQQGLMFRREMAQSAGMLFLYDRPNHATFWMKNTLIPLDLIFVDPEGVVTRVHENAVPHDETPIDGGPGVLAVLEINGGLARKLGIAPGHVLRHPGLPQQGAVWPCN